MSLTSSEYSLQLSLYILVYRRLVVHAYETPRAFHRNIPRKLISDLPKHIKPFTESHFPVKPLFYPFSDNIKIGIKFRNINLHCLACIIISFHYEKKIVIPFSVTLISWISIVGNPRSVSLLLPKVRPMVGLASLRCETDRVFPAMLNQL